MKNIIVKIQIVDLDKNSIIEEQLFPLERKENNYFTPIILDTDFLLSGWQFEPLIEKIEKPSPKGGVKR